MPFNPDKFLAETAPKQQAFNPDKFLQETDPNQAQMRADQERQFQEAQTNRQFEEMAQRPEAELGIVNRSRYSIEPIQSNRIALLQQEYGAENVVKSPKGDLFVRTPDTGEFRPINAPGFSTADVAEFAGSTPEMMGSGAGALLGIESGSLPGMAIGGATGSIARQAVSGFLGTPQVATPEERAGEIALSTGTSMLGGTIGKQANKLIGRLAKRFAPEVTKQAAAMEKTAAKRGIKLTLGQKYGGKLEEGEKMLREIPIVGRKARKEFEKQSEQIFNEIKKDVGNFTAPDMTRGSVGIKVKELALAKNDVLKTASGQLFDEVAESSNNIFMPAKSAKQSLIKSMSGLRLFDGNGNPLSYKGTAGVSEEAFSNMQRALKPIIGAIDEAISQPKGMGKGFETSGMISLNELNAMRKTLSHQIKSYGAKARDMGYDDVILKKIERRFLDTIETGLKRESPEQLAKFRTARQLWAKAKESDELIKNLRLDPKLINHLADENVLDDIFANTAKLKKYQKLTSQENIKDFAEAYIQHKFEKMTKFGNIPAGRMYNAIDNKGVRESLELSYGKQNLNELKRLLKFAHDTKIPINPSGTELTKLKEISVGNLVTGIGYRTILGVLNGAVKLPYKLTKATIQTLGQEPRRKAIFEGRKRLKPVVPRMQ